MNFKRKENDNINSNKDNYYNDSQQNDNPKNNKLMKSKSNSNIKSNKKNKNINIKKEINKSFQIFTEKRKIKRNINPEFNNTMNNNNINDISSDNSLDNIEINTKITENILKPTLEKFESYMNVNNFGKSQNVYSNNTFNRKKEIFGEKNIENKLTQSKGNKDK